MTDNDITMGHMLRALELARKGRGTASPNPMVGAVIVKDGRIVGEGFHERAGESHAEINALRRAGGKARGADLYVTLEPCNHQGRTPPCTNALIKAGLARVFIAGLDPNPLVNGSGAARLREAGLEVYVGLAEVEACRLNETYRKHIVTGLPFVTAKMALSLDGRLAAASGESKWISSEEARRRAHAIRAQNDAVMVGVGTILADDPQLTVRLPEWGGRQPVRVIVDSRLRTPPESKVVSDGSGSRTLVAALDAASQERAEVLAAAGATVIRVADKGGHVDLRALMGLLGRSKIQSVLLEGGSGLFAAAFGEGLVDKAVVFMAPLFLGDEGTAGPLPHFAAKTMNDALRLSDTAVEVIGDNVLIQGYVKNPCSPG